MAKSRAWLWKWIGAALVASVGYSSYSAWRADAAYQERLARLKELGVATRVEDLPVDETDPKLQAAINKLEAVPSGDQYARQILSWNTSEGPERAIRSREALADVIPLLLAAADATGVGFKVADYETPDPKMLEMSNVMSILAGEAKLAALDGDYRRSLLALEALHKFSQLCAEGSGYVPYLTANTGLDRHHSSTRVYLDHFAANREALDSLRTHLQSTPSSLDFRPSYQSQFAIVQEWLARMSTTSNMRMNAAQYSYLDTAKGYAKDSSFVKTKARHQLASNWIAAAETMKGRPTDYALYADLRKLETSGRQDNSLVGELVQECDFFPASGRVGMELEQVARKRVMLGATLLLLERLETGRLPASLPVGETFTDPLTGKPLIYKLKENGSVLYSIGADMTDNGGRKAGAGGRDIVFEFSPK